MISLKFNSPKGFTLIELLVVIGILGILAAALLQTIDPFEQLKKGRDTVRRNTAIEVLNATTRYYATHGVFPWPSGTGCTTNPTAASLRTIGGCITLLQNDGELKTGFLDAVNGNNDSDRIFVNGTATGSISVCYAPEAKSFINDPQTKYTNNGAAGCTVGSGTCFQCFQ